MYTMEEIKVRSKLVKDVVNLVMAPKGISVEHIYLVGSYASDRANDWSDIDYLVQLKGGKYELTYPTFNEMMEIRKKIDNRRIHCIYGTLEAQLSMQAKNAIKYAWKKIE